MNTIYVDGRIYLSYSQLAKSYGIEPGLVANRYKKGLTGYNLVAPPNRTRQKYADIKNITKCYSCQTKNCDYIDYGTPISGWKALKRDHAVFSREYLVYEVQDCPLYSPPRRIKENEKKETHNNVLIQYPCDACNTNTKKTCSLKRPPCDRYLQWLRAKWQKLQELYKIL